MQKSYTEQKMCKKISKNLQKNRKKIAKKLQKNCKKIAKCAKEIFFCVKFLQILNLHTDFRPREESVTYLGFLRSVLSSWHEGLVGENITKFCGLG